MMSENDFTASAEVHKVELKQGGKKQTKNIHTAKRSGRHMVELKETV